MVKDTVRQRRPHNKTRDGCVTCRQRHIKCDELKPECRNCLGRRLLCGGYARAKSKPFEGMLAPAPSMKRPSAFGISTTEPPWTHERNDSLPRDYRSSLPKHSGCLTCRKRRMRCDAQLPNCTRCIGANLLCERYTPTADSVSSDCETFVYTTDGVSDDVSSGGISEADNEWKMLATDNDLLHIQRSPDNTIERPIHTFTSPTELLNWLSLYNIRLPELDYFKAPFPMSALDTPYTCLRHIYAAACLHSLSFESPVLTEASLAEIQTLALEQETQAIHANCIENLPPAIIALCAFFFAWTQLWQLGWDCGMTHLRQAVALVSKRSTTPPTTSDEVSLDEVGTFIEAFVSCVPKVLLCKKTLKAMPSYPALDLAPESTSQNITTLPTGNLEMCWNSQGHIDHTTLGPDLSDRGAHVTIGQRQGTMRHSCLRLAYITFHSHRALLWATGAYAETSRLARLPIPRSGDTSSKSLCNLTSASAQTRHVRGLLTVMHEMLSALLSLWAKDGTGQLELPAELQELESPFAACMKHLSLFLGRKAGFDLQLWEGQCRSSVKFACMFVIGEREARNDLREDVLCILRRGVKVRRSLGLDAARPAGLCTAPGDQEYQFSGAKPSAVPEMQWIDVDGAV